MKAVYMKAFFICFLFLIILLVHISVFQNSSSKYINTLNRSIKPIKVIEPDSNVYEETATKKQKLKYILQWTSPKNIPFIYMGEGQKTFIERNCSYINCFVTADRNYLDDYTKFDVIAFAGPEVVQMSKASLPTRRSPHQKFVFASIESSDYYPICSNYLNDFFNWTWTYKMNSDAVWDYMVVRDSDKMVIGPKAEMHWIKFEDMDPVSEELKEQLKTKTKAAAWFVSNCQPRSFRDKFVKELQSKLKKYDLNVDIYGRCGSLSCPVDAEECSAKIKEDYYFYLSFENSFSEDYVTEKLLLSLKNMAVPIVYGGANYTRFMPDGMYLNARELGAEKLAAKMAELIKKTRKICRVF